MSFLHFVKNVESSLLCECFFVVVVLVRLLFWLGCWLGCCLGKGWSKNKSNPIARKLQVEPSHDIFGD